MYQLKNTTIDKMLTNVPTKEHNNRQKLTNVPTKEHNNRHNVNKCTN